MIISSYAIRLKEFQNTLPPLPESLVDDLLVDLVMLYKSFFSVICETDKILFFDDEFQK
jgi:hypothetical protein